MTRLTVLILETPTVFFIFWGIEKEVYGRFFVLPIIGILVMSIAGLAGLFVARLYRRKRLFNGTYIVASMFSNQGPTLGGFLALLYLGNEGLELSQFFMLFYVPYFFTVGFLVARLHADAKDAGIWTALSGIFRDPLSFLPISATVFGVIFSLIEIPLYRGLDIVRQVFLIGTVASYSISFGLGMRLRIILKGFVAYFGILPVKFLISPLAGLGLCVLFGFTLNPMPLAVKVVILQSAMPVALWSVMASKLFKLDEDIALGLWLFTTFSVVLFLPAIAWMSKL